MHELPEELRDGLERLLDGVPAGRLAPAVEALIARYREGGAAPEAILDSEPAARAYAAYRMPATYAAVRSALGALAARAPGFAPASQLDVGGGTGAAVWAAADVWHTAGAPPVEAVVLERAEQAAAVGRELAAGGGLPGAEWRPFLLEPATAELPAADLVTIAYVLGELDERQRASAVRAAAAAGRAVVVVEPGTPAGYRRVLEARDALVGAGLTVLAPCPHGGACPLAGGDDWCHFAARVRRTALHRRLKGGELGHEDEKFSYVAAVADAAAVAGEPAAGRVVRHPLRRKGMVEMRVCLAAGSVDRVIASKRDRELYRAAKDVDWGDAWPPAG